MLDSVAVLGAHELVHGVSDSAHCVGAVLTKTEKQLGNVVDVLGRTRDDLLQVIAIILQARVVQLVLQFEREKLWQLRLDWSGLCSFVHL